MEVGDRVRIIDRHVNAHWAGRLCRNQCGEILKTQNGDISGIDDIVHVSLKRLFSGFGRSFYRVNTKDLARLPAENNPHG